MHIHGIIVSYHSWVDALLHGASARAMTRPSTRMDTAMVGDTQQLAELCVVQAHPSNFTTTRPMHFPAGWTFLRPFAVSPRPAVFHC